MSEEHKQEDFIYATAQAVIMFGPNDKSSHEYTASEIAGALIQLYWHVIEYECDIDIQIDNSKYFG